MEENKNFSESLLLIQLRNAFYKKKFHFMLGIFALCLIVIGVLISILVYVKTFQVKPRYFVADEVGRLIKDIPLSELNMSNEELVDWTLNAVESANSFDYVNYRRQLQNAQKYFTDQSWATYMKELTISDNLLALTMRRWVFVGKVIAKPTLITQGKLGETLAFRYEMPLLVTYLKPPAYDVKTSTSNAFIVTVIVIRKNLLESYKGLAVYSMVISNAPEVEKKMTIPAS
jgi:intracellular multiplication protein IcmL